MAWIRCTGNTGGSLKVRTASGAIATFETNMADVLQEVKCEINAKQDLHGYSEPWASGAGKNKLPLDSENIKSHNGDYSSWTGNTYTTNGITFRIIEDADNGITEITASGTATDNIVFHVCYGTPYLVINNSITIVLQNVSRGGLKYDGTWVDVPPTPLTIANVTNIEEFWVRIANGATLNNANITPMICLSTTVDYTYEPYSNICPIEGYSEANITRCGVNLWDGTKQDNVGVNATTGNLYASTGTFTTDYIKVAPNTAYYANPTNWKTWACFYDASKTYVNYTSIVNGVINTTVEAVYMRISGDMNEMSTACINSPATDTTYHPYNGQTYTVSFGQTVYGGVLDVTRGKLRVNKLLLDMGDVEWYYPASDEFFYADIANIVPNPTWGATSDILSDIFETTNPNAIANKQGDNTIAIWPTGHRIVVRDTAYTDRIAFRTAMTGKYVVYPLATPFDIDLTPEVISAVVGVNNVFGDCGSSTVEYLNKASADMYKNIWDGVIPHSNTYIDQNSGAELSSVNWSSTDYLDVSGNTGLLYRAGDIASSGYGAFYDENKVYIGACNRASNDGSHAIPSGAKYVRLSQADSSFYGLVVIKV